MQVIMLAFVASMLQGCMLESKLKPAANIILGLVCHHFESPYTLKEAQNICNKLDLTKLKKYAISSSDCPKILQHMAHDGMVMDCEKKSEDKIVAEKVCMKKVDEECNRYVVHHALRFRCDNECKEKGWSDKKNTQPELQLAISNQCNKAWTELLESSKGIARVDAQCSQIPAQDLKTMDLNQENCATRVRDGLEGIGKTLCSLHFSRVLESQGNSPSMHAVMSAAEDYKKDMGKNPVFTMETDGDLWKSKGNTKRLRLFQISGVVKGPWQLFSWPVATLAVTCSVASVVVLGSVWRRRYAMQHLGEDAGPMLDETTGDEIQQTVS